MIFVLVLNTITDPMSAIIRVSTVVLFQAVMYFINLLYLTPKLLEEGKRKEFVLWIILMVAIYVVGLGALDLWMDTFMPFHRHPIGPKPFLLIFLFRFFTAIPPLVVSTLIVKSVLLSAKNKESLELKNRMLEAETNALKAQINPHFLFNTLNNIYSLSQMRSDKTGTAIMNLSEILRFVTYESNQARVPLASEIKQIENFIELQYLKDDEHDNIKVNLDPIEGNYEIAPLLLIPFIENCFKHSGHEDKSEGWIKISLRVHEDQLHLKCTNSVVRDDKPKDGTGGVGLDNVEKRLNLLYPDRHEIFIKEDRDQFEVDLKINLKG